MLRTFNLKTPAKPCVQNTKTYGYKPPLPYDHKGKTETAKLTIESLCKEDRSYKTACRHHYNLQPTQTLHSENRNCKTAHTNLAFRKQKLQNSPHKPCIHKTETAKQKPCIQKTETTKQPTQTLHSQTTKQPTQTLHSENRNCKTAHTNLAFRKQANKLQKTFTSRNYKTAHTNLAFTKLKTEQTLHSQDRNLAFRRQKLQNSPHKPCIQKTETAKQPTQTLHSQDKLQNSPYKPCIHKTITAKQPTQTLQRRQKLQDRNTAFKRQTCKTAHTNLTYKPYTQKTETAKQPIQTLHSGDDEQKPCVLHMVTAKPLSETFIQKTRYH